MLNPRRRTRSILLAEDSTQNSSSVHRVAETGMNGEAGGGRLLVAAYLTEKKNSNILNDFIN